MPTLLLSHPAAAAHVVPEGHPERPDRIRAVERVLAGDAFQALRREEAAEASVDVAKLAHDGAYVEHIAAMRPEAGFLAIDNDTFVSEGTIPAVLRALGGATRAVDAVMAREAGNAFLAMRPPGHHAETARAMGFCFFNSAAVAARHAMRRHGAERVAIMDFDVHHGNGTEEIFWDDPAVLYASTHEMPLYPGTGDPAHRGAHENIVNVALGAGSDGAAFREAMTQAVLPRIDAFRPDLVIISAGFDAHHRDPLASLRLVADDFAFATRELCAIAARRSGGRVVSVLEGGYDLVGLSESTAAHVRALMEASA
jgi:acetoin utilization deacetylase AcuC-like enzyme